MMVDEMMDKNPKAVVLVGSLLPLGEPTSDALDNLTLALQWLKTHQDGIRFVMSGKLWRVGEANKDAETGKIVAKL